jgi:hypothetical protein
MRLHESSVADFIESPGFGFARMAEPHRRYIDLPEDEPIPLPSPRPPLTGFPEGQEEPLRLPSSLSPGQSSPVPEEGALGQFHRFSVRDFVNERGFGYVRDREHVKGFQSHRFSAMPELGKVAGETRRWQVDNLQLISLLKYEEPVAYQSRHLPRMDELRTAETRPLDPFEKQALAALRQGGSLVVRSGKDWLRMLGAVRALRQCLACHEAERGDLLGAFSYTLRPAP